MKKGYIYIALTTLLFSSMEVVLKSVSNDFNPMQLTLDRFFVGSIILFPFSIKNLRSKDLYLSFSDLKYFSFLGLICVVISMSLYQLAVSNTQASTVGVLFSCNPIFVMFFAYFILNEKIYSYNVYSLILETIGIIIIINPLHNKMNLTGIILTISSAMIFSVYSVLGKKKSLKFGGLVVTCFSFLFGSIEMLIISILTKIDIISNFLNAIGLEAFSNIPIFTNYSLSNLPNVIYIFIFVTGIGYTLYFKSMEETSANTASLVFFFKPVISPILAFIFIKESISSNMIFGILFIIIGSIVSILPPMLNYHKEASQNINDMVPKI
ncbi:DMT family transporter [Romboutsia maritimum]|uniref:DMT family transporter n=1 Tax=Romboutsia maritimum TaxID=2020948 RepID=A0A371IPY2_9FIRM|nr:DMT family transporter [Romboutsia maritimum]RDY22537.1 DMT family transporter [Romboutsia maritimum]